MKKILFTTAAALLFVAASLQAQQSFVAYTAKSANKHINTTPPVKSASMALLERKNVKAYDHFTAMYGIDVQADILIEANSTMIVFNNAGILTRAYYKPSGLYTGTISYYDAANLPIEITNTIAAEFGGYSIFGVTEIATPDNTVYMVKIENAKYWKTVQVKDGEAFVTEQFRKGK